jgi:hypothetical protein
MSVENKYRERLMEGMLSKGLIAIAALLVKSKTRQNVEDIQQKIKEDPAIQATMASLDQVTKELNRQMDSFCERNPNSAACKKRRK